MGRINPHNQERTKLCAGSLDIRLYAPFKIEQEPQDVIRRPVSRLENQRQKVEPAPYHETIKEGERKSQNQTTEANKKRPSTKNECASWISKLFQIAET